MTDFQEKQIDNIYHILNNWSPSQKIVLKFIVRHYPEILDSGKSSWRNIKLYKKHHRITERAAKVLEESNNWRDVHFEHITPVKVVYDKLIELENPTKEKITEIMSESEVIVLSKEEAVVLDGSINKLYPLDGNMVSGKSLKSKGSREERLSAINAKLSKKYINNSLDGDL